MSPSYRVTIEDAPHPEDVNVIREGLTAYNLQHAPDDQYRPLAVFVRGADGAVVGGLIGDTYWGWLAINLMWLADEARQQGLGRQVLGMAEQEALRRGCRHAHVDTLDFQALAFYQKHGYSVFGVLEDLPPGHARYFLRKDL